MLFKFLRSLIAGPLLSLQAGDILAAEAVRAACPSADATDYYFPSGAFDKAAKRSDGDPDAFRRDWYSKHLRAAEALSISCGGSGQKEAYRFVWLRTFHHPIIIEVTRLESSVTVSTVELNGAGGYAPGTVKHRRSANASLKEWDRLTKDLAAVGFWKAETEKVASQGETVSPDGTEDVTVGVDGAQWIFEGQRENQYTVIDRWSPESGPARELGLAFLALAKIHIRQRELY